MGSAGMPVYVYHLLHSHLTDPCSEPVKREVKAAYFTDEGDLTVFKDSHHQFVYGLRKSLVLTIERGRPV